MLFVRVTGTVVGDVTAACTAKLAVQLGSNTGQGLPPNRWQSFQPHLMCRKSFRTVSATRVSCFILKQLTLYQVPRADPGSLRMACNWCTFLWQVRTRSSLSQAIKLLGLSLWQAQLALILCGLRTDPAGLQLFSFVLCFEPCLSVV
jgi:hypothetical protein